MRSHVFVLLFLPFIAQAQEFRDTAVPNAQIHAVIRDVAEWHDMRHPDCRFTKATGSTTVEKDSDGTVEHWTIEACSGKSFTYEVAVFPEPDGGITDMVGDISSDIASNDDASPPPVQEECAEARRKFDALSANKDPNIDRSEMAQLAVDLAVCNSQKP